MPNTTTHNQPSRIPIDMMNRCLASRDDTELGRCLADMLNAMPPGVLPLQSVCTQGGIVDETERTISLLGFERTDWGAHMRAGVFFTEVVGGCNCHDDPTRHPAYCVLEIDLNRQNASVDIAID